MKQQKKGGKVKKNKMNGNDANNQSPAPATQSTDGKQRYALSRRQGIAIAREQIPKKKSPMTSKGAVEGLPLTQEEPRVKETDSQQFTSKSHVHLSQQMHSQQPVHQQIQHHEQQYQQLQQQYQLQQMAQQQSQLMQNQMQIGSPAPPCTPLSRSSSVSSPFYSTPCSSPMFGWGSQGVSGIAIPVSVNCDSVGARMEKLRKGQSALMDNCNLTSAKEDDKIKVLKDAEVNRVYPSAPNTGQNIKGTDVNLKGIGLGVVVTSAPAIMPTTTIVTSTAALATTLQTGGMQQSTCAVMSTTITMHTDEQMAVPSGTPMTPNDMK